MRRIGVVWVLCLCLLFSGCQKDSVLPTTTSFSCAVLFSGEDFSVEANVSRSGVGQMTLECTSPPTLAGLRVIQNGETVIVSQNGIETAVSPEDLPEEAMFLELCRVLDAVALKSDIVPSDRVQGTCRGVPYTLTYDAKTGNLQSIMIPNRRFSVEFSDFHTES